MSVLDRYRQLTGDGEFLELQQISIGELFERLRTHLLQKLPQSAALLKLHLDAQPNSQVAVRPADIERLSVAIVHNAVDAILQRRQSQPAFAGSIFVEFAIRDGNLEIAFTDNGIGISAQNRAFVFAPFFTTKDVNEGMGLGLSLARAIAFMHDGSLRLNPLSENTQFILQLPLTSSAILKESA